MSSCGRVKANRVAAGYNGNWVITTQRVDYWVLANLVVSTSNGVNSTYGTLVDTKKL